MNVGLQSWKVTPDRISIQLYLPGVDEPHLQQKGRSIHVSGSNNNYGVSYNYVVPLHPDCRDTINHVFHQGLLVIDTDNINNVNRVLEGRHVVNPPVVRLL